MKIHKRLLRLLYAFGLAVLLLLTLWGFVSTAQAQSSQPLDVGYLDFSYQAAPGSPAVTEPTAEKPESKLWWNDGFWWGSLYNSAAPSGPTNPTVGEYRIYRLNWGTQAWEDTGVAIDDREDTTSDALWDDTNNKLYIASHIHQSNSSHASNVSDRGRLYRYSYDETTQAYALDTGFPRIVNEDRTETLVVDKDSTGRLWVTYVSRDTTQSDYQVFVNAATGDGLTWGTPFTLPFSSTHVAQDDISSLVAFSDTEGYKIGVMWSNALSNTFHFASRLDSVSGVQNGWVETTLTLPTSANDHISLRAMETSGRLFAAVKTNAVTSTEPLVGLLARDTDGTFSFITYSIAADGDTRPIVMIDEGDLATPSDDKVHVFVTGVEGGSQICHKSAAITTPLSGMSFLPAGNCGTPFISDSAFDLIDNATSAKHNVNQTTGLVVLASDEVNGRFYVHNKLDEVGEPPPVVTLRSPGFNATGIPVNTVVAATFSKLMISTTLTTSNFTVVSSSGSVTGTVTYSSTTRTATFTPNVLLKANTTYTATLTSGVKGSDGQILFGAPEVWTFTTELAKVQFSSASYSVNEGTASTTITATLNTISTITVTVNYTTSDGTAAAGSDYNAISGTLTFTPGLTSRTFAISVIPDIADEANETVNLGLSSPVSATLNVPGTATLTIVDDDGTPSAQFDLATYSAGESDGSQTIEVNLSSPSAFTLTVDYATTISGTATAGSDYTSVSNTLTFTPLLTTRTFTMPVLPDTLDEVDQTVIVQLSNPSPAVSLTLGSPFTTTLTILDDDDPPTVYFTSGVFSATEDIGLATITATLSAQSELTITANYTATGVNALAGTDYLTLTATGILTFTPPMTNTTFTVSIITDTLDEPDETINLQLGDPTQASLGSPADAVLKILDDDPTPTVQFDSANYDVGEGAGTATITVTLSAPSGQSVAVDYATSPGTAAAGSDYTSIPTTTLTFEPGVMTQTFSVVIENDALDEASETINLTLENPDDATLDPLLATATVTIVDDDEVRAQFGLATYTVSESGGSQTIEVNLSAPSVFTLTVDYATTISGTATAGSDYTTVSKTLTFAPMDPTETFTVPVLPDPLDEGDQTVIVELSNPSPALSITLGSPFTTTLTILDDDDPPTVYFTSDVFSATEDIGLATITATLSAQSELTITANYTATGVNALAGTDYLTATGILIFTPTVTTQTFTVSIITDTLDEPDESINLQLGDPTQASLGSPADAVLAILDDDPTPTVQFDSENYNVGEGAGTATVTATLSAASGLTVTVNYTTSNGTALAGSDYMTATGTLTFTPDVITQTFTVTITNDSAGEADETVNLALSSPSNATLGAPASATLTITDNEVKIYLPIIIRIG